MAFQRSATYRSDFNKGVADEGYEIRYLMDKTGITSEQARVLIRLFGGDRRLMEEEARKLRSIAKQ